LNPSSSHTVTSVGRGTVDDYLDAELATAQAGVVSLFTEMPLMIRLQYIEVMIFMSDYKQAEAVFERCMQDFRKDRDDLALKVKCPELLRLISIGMYLLTKLGRYEDAVDFGESVLSNRELMRRLNPIALFYIFQYTKFRKELIEILQFESDEYKRIKLKFMRMRAEIKKRWINDPNCFAYGHLDP
jgi:hypothetical protein